MRSGFSHIILLVLIVVSASIVFVIIKSGLPFSKVIDYGQVDWDYIPRSMKVRWDFDNSLNKWIRTSNNKIVPKCDEPFIINSPVDLNLVSGILYPGQIRGTDYKPHGSFRFDDLVNNEVEVRAITEGYVKKVAKYEDEWSEQKLLFYVNPCGIMVMHDHLVDVSPKLQELYDTIPLGENGDSRTTDVSDKDVKLEKGELIATSVGYEYFPGGANDKNIFVDFGLYDLREENGVIYSNELRSEHTNINEYGQYARCWLDYLSNKDGEYLSSLPPGGSEGSVSDYCDTI